MISKYVTFRTDNIGRWLQSWQIFVAIFLSAEVSVVPRINKSDVITCSFKTTKTSFLSGKQNKKIQ